MKLRFSLFWLFVAIGTLGAGLGVLGRGYFAPLETRRTGYFPDGVRFRTTVRVQGMFKTCEYIVIGSDSSGRYYGTSRRGVPPRDIGISYHPGAFYLNGKQVELPTSRTAVLFFHDNTLYEVELSEAEERAVRRLDFNGFSRMPAYQCILRFSKGKVTPDMPRRIMPARFVGE